MKKLERQKYVLENHEKQTLAELADNCGCSVTTIKSDKRALGLVKSARFKEIEDFVKNNHKEKSLQDMAKSLGTKVDTVRDAMYKLGIPLEKYRTDWDKIAGDKGYTLMELRDNYSCKVKCNRCSTEKTITRISNLYPCTCNLSSPVTFNDRCVYCDHPGEIVCGNCKGFHEAKVFFNKTMQSRGYKIIGFYSGGRNPVEVECENGHKRVAVADNLMRYECKECTIKGEGFHVYVLRSGEDVVKIGISSNVSERIKYINRNSGLVNFVPMYISDSMSLASARDIERSLHKEFENYKLHDKAIDKTSGSTEWFLGEIIELVLKHPLLLK